MQKQKLEGLECKLMKVQIMICMMVKLEGLDAIMKSLTCKKEVLRNAIREYNIIKGREGLDIALEEVCQGASRMNVRHIWANFTNKFRGNKQLSDALWAYLRATTVQQFDMKMDQFKILSPVR
ncbi:hypothetical protein CRG98_022034 [Punica granatum]|uniref:Uncharacterized protein n=1 Tax=Punica granatum TaxID=22663 RepID=A0A2I0JNQ8_PUNGR|nr:hypothetical protein CRG98_022034 [Punica granatum]